MNTPRRLVAILAISTTLIGGCATKNGGELLHQLSSSSKDMIELKNGKRAPSNPTQYPLAVLAQAYETGDLELSSEFGIFYRAELDDEKRLGALAQEVVDTFQFKEGESNQYSPLLDSRMHSFAQRNQENKANDWMYKANITEPIWLNILYGTTRGKGGGSDPIKKLGDLGGGNLDGNGT